MALVADAVVPRLPTPTAGRAVRSSTHFDACELWLQRSHLVWCVCADRGPSNPLARDREDAPQNDNDGYGPQRRPRRGGMCRL